MTEHLLRIRPLPPDEQVPVIECVAGADVKPLDMLYYQQRGANALVTTNPTDDFAGVALDETPSGGRVRVARRGEVVGEMPDPSQPARCRIDLPTEAGAKPSDAEVYAAVLVWREKYPYLAIEYETIYDYATGQYFVEVRPRP